MGIEATFFVVGEFAEKQPDLARARALGHRLGNHTWTHDTGGRPVWLMEPDSSRGLEWGRHTGRRAREPHSLDN